MLQHLCSLSLRPNLASLMLACSGVSLATLTLALALPRLRCLALNTHAVRYPGSTVRCSTPADVACAQFCHFSTIVLSQACQAGHVCVCQKLCPAMGDVSCALQVKVLQDNGGALCHLLVHPGKLQQLSLACDLSTGLAQLLSGLTGLERLAIPGMAIAAPGGALRCLSVLTQLSGG